MICQEWKPTHKLVLNKIHGSIANNTRSGSMDGGDDVEAIINFMKNQSESLVSETKSIKV